VVNETDERPGWRRAVFDLTTAVSMACLVMVVVFWIRSHWAHDHYVISGRLPQGEFAVDSDDGLLSIGTWVTITVPPPPMPKLVVPIPPIAPMSFVWMASGTRLYYVSVALLFWPLPLLWTLRRASQREALLNATVRCRSCGYDLRASVERCPECGAPIPSRSK
jgi:hypothetical protein